MPSADRAEHHVWQYAVTNAPGQSIVRCWCGWSRIVVTPRLGEAYGAAHYEHHGIEPRPVDFGLMIWQV